MTALKKFYKNGHPKKERRSFLCADPFAFRWLGEYYLFSTGSFCPIYKSTDLLSWQYVGTAIKPDQNNPDIKGCYAPEVTYYGGLFYLCFSPKGNKHRIYVSKRIDGGFVPATDFKCEGIDGSFCLENDKTVTFFRSADVIGKEAHGIYYKNCQTPFDVDGDWKKIESAYLNGWTEGPFSFKRGDYKYLIYTGNHYLSKGYRINYGYCKQDESYDKLKSGNTVIISTQKKFNSLGHGAVVTCPNLDGIALTFHNMIKPTKRFYSVVNLTTNQNKLYANGLANYTCPAFARPDFECKGIEKLILIDNKFLLPLNVGKRFTAELSFYPSFPAEIYFSGITLKLENGKATLYDDKRQQENDFTPMQNDNPIVVRCENGQRFKVYINGCKVFELPPLSNGYVAYSSEQVPLYTAISHNVDGDSDKELIKNVPSRFSSTSCEQNVVFQNDEEQNYVYANNLSYKINVEKTAWYKIILKIKCDKKSLCHVGIDDKIYRFEIPPCQARHALTPIKIKKGIHQLKIDANIGLFDVEFVALPDRIKNKITFNAKNTVCLHGKIKGDVVIYDQPASYDKDFASQTEKSSSALLSKNVFTDFVLTCRVSELAQNPFCQDRGGIMLRANDYWYYNNQVPQSFIGYLVCVYDNYLMLKKVNYGTTTLLQTPLQEDAVKDLKIECIGNRLVFYVDDQMCCTYQDNDAVFAGHIGVLEIGQGFKINNLTVTPAKQIAENRK